MVKGKPRVQRVILVQPHYASQRGEGFFGDVNHFFKKTLPRGIKKGAKATYSDVLKPVGNHFKKLPAVANDVLKIATPILKVPFSLMGPEGKAAAMGFDVVTGLTGKMAGRGRGQRGRGNDFPYST